MFLRSTRFRFLAAALAFVCAIASTSSFANTLAYQSTPGDWVGQGQSLTFTEGVTATASTDKRHVSVAVNTTDHWYYLDLAAPEGQELIPGTYDGAVRFPFQEPYQPGLSFSGDGRGCNTLTGTFTIKTVKIGPYGYVENLDATWTQNCEGFMPPLYGQVEISNPPPPPALVLDLTANGSGTVNRTNGVATVTGTVKCSSATTAHIYLSLSERVGRKSQAYGSNSLSIACGPTATTWSANVTSQTGVPFARGQAQFDVSVNAYDPNYGGIQSKSASTVVNLTFGQRRAVSARGIPLSN
jgi:hypothetical protein